MSIWWLILIVPVVFSIGFVVGAAWCGTGDKNKEYDRCLGSKHE